MHWPALSLIVPNYNGAALLKTSLESLVQAGEQYPGDWELILVDDASTDGSLAVVEPIAGPIRILRHAQNRGFAEAVHSGLQAAAHAYIFLLNSDVSLSPNCIAPLVQALREDEALFAVSPLVEDERGRPQFVSWPRYRLIRGKLRPQPWTRETIQARQAAGQPLYGLYASGGSMLFAKERFLALGGFLPLYRPFYSEDLDLCARAWMRGWKIRCVPESRVIHRSQGTIGRLFAPRLVHRIRLRNRFVFLLLYGEPRRIFMSYLPWNLLRALTRLLRGDATLLLALIQGMKMYPRIRAERRRLAAAQPLLSPEALLHKISQQA